MDRIELRAKFDKTKFDKEKLEFTGLVNNYKKSKVLTRNGKKFREIISREVFEKALHKKPEIKLFINHQPYVDVAEKIEVVAEEKGLVTKVKLLENAKGLFDRIKSNEFGEFSFGMKVLKDKWVSDGDVDLRIVEDIELVEISILNVEAAYNGTEVLEYRKFANDELWKLDLMKYKLEILKLR